MSRTTGFCNRCQQQVPAEGWGANNSWCKACMAAYQRARLQDPAERAKANETAARWRKESPESYLKSRRKYLLKSQYGLTPEELDAMFEEQGHSCAICAVPLERRQHGYAVDHDHEDGDVRGLLCSSCNLMVGQAGDDPDRLVAAAAYLIRHNLKKEGC